MLVVLSEWAKTMQAKAHTVSSYKLDTTPLPPSLANFLKICFFPLGEDV